MRHRLRQTGDWLSGLSHSCYTRRLTPSCAPRLAQCRDLLRTRVIPKLRLRDIQALRQTTCALHRTVQTAEAEVEALALVSPAADVHQP